MFPVPHLPRCFVYRYAHTLFGVDRRLFCDCGAYPAGPYCPLPQDHSVYIHVIYPSLSHSIRCSYWPDGVHRWGYMGCVCGQPQSSDDGGDFSDRLIA